MSNAVCHAVTNGVRIWSRPEPDQNQIVLKSVCGSSVVNAKSIHQAVDARDPQGTRRSTSARGLMDAATRKGGAW